MNVDNLIKQLNSNEMWIKNADAKLSIILTFIGVLIGVLSVRVFELNQISDISFVLVLLLIVSGVFAILSVIFAIKGLTAKLKNPKKSLWYFGGVSKYTTAENYIKAKTNESDEDFKLDLLNQIYITSNIATKKFKWFNWSLRITIATFGLFIILMVVMII